MKIRKYHPDELDRLVEIWYEGSLYAHGFIMQSYWDSQRKAMKETYLPMAETRVLHAEGGIVGFISMVDNYLAALFVHVKYQDKGYGKKLLQFVKEQRKQIQLKVYQKNEQAIRFYRKNGFQIQAEQLDEPTGEKEYVMEWNSGN
ncbi:MULTISPECIES: N-acetyltransferase [Clostridia]|uniref:N-acetyltransferase n=1 Tax=Clostridia TaxID=186801 RepID=UPI000EA27566|nr:MULTISPECIES: N-acetyltransferase [Clostridia]NBJ70670.1 N-acetyltransferase [Roseburia sp. 1XD42-34]RKI75919.1 N-acetyltransferase [Clostridium sp. 1xD42-85]